MHPGEDIDVGWLYWLLLLAGVVVAALITDWVRAHDRPDWPIALVIIGGIVAAGLSYNTIGVSFTLGAALGWSLLTGYTMVKNVSAQRAERDELRRRRQDAEKRRLES